MRPRIVNTWIQQQGALIHLFSWNDRIVPDNRKADSLSVLFACGHLVAKHAAEEKIPPIVSQPVVPRVRPSPTVDAAINGLPLPVLHALLGSKVFDVPMLI